jgi:hypothetical protein
LTVVFPGDFPGDIAGDNFGLRFTAKPFLCPSAEGQRKILTFPMLLDATLRKASFGSRKMAARRPQGTIY